MLLPSHIQNRRTDGRLPDVTLNINRQHFRASRVYCACSTCSVALELPRERAEHMQRARTQDCAVRRWCRDSRSCLADVRRRSAWRRALTRPRSPPLGQTGRNSLLPKSEVMCGQLHVTTAASRAQNPWYSMHRPSCVRLIANSSRSKLQLHAPVGDVISACGYCLDCWAARRALGADLLGANPYGSAAK